MKFSYVMRVDASILSGCIFCSIAMQCYFMRDLNWPETITLGIATACVLIPEAITDYVGLALALVVLVPIYFKNRKKSKAV